MTKFIDLTNQIINNIKFLKMVTMENGVIKWKCKCYCGNIFIARSNHIKRNLTKSCGCLNSKNTIAKNKLTRKWDEKYKHLYQLWNHIIGRCFRINDANYFRYGGRGITIYEEWISDFNKFAKWIIENLGEKPSKRYSLDRINNNGNYEPGNLRWATDTQQARNKSNSKLNELKAKEIKESNEPTLILAKRYNVSKSTIHRIKQGKRWS